MLMRSEQVYMKGREPITLHSCSIQLLLPGAGRSSGMSNSLAKMRAAFLETSACSSVVPCSSQTLMCRATTALSAKDRQPPTPVLRKVSRPPTSGYCLTKPWHRSVSRSMDAKPAKHGCSPGLGRSLKRASRHLGRSQSASSSEPVSSPEARLEDAVAACSLRLWGSSGSSIMNEVVLRRALPPVQSKVSTCTESSGPPSVVRST
mmetsp:Transcript_42380/g.122604  ORF Transcript_42380/g.122604 Transcript_42380/m.122604 type:complete len:205 (+) Transcript_42380:3236-3850(+)